MKKGKLFLTLAFVFVLSICSLAGCGNSGKNSTISLATAKETIVEALKIEDVSGQMVLGNSVESQGNRNIFARLKNSKVKMVGNFDYGTAIYGYVQRVGADWTKYSLGSSESAAYYDGENVYLNDSETITDFQSSYFGLILMTLDCVYVDLLFLDEAFDSIYNSEVAKTTTDDGYIYTMDVNMPNYVDYVSAKVEEMGIGSEGVFGEGDELQRNKDEGSVDLKIYFDKSNEITKIEMTVSCCTGSEQLYDTIVNVTRAGDFSAPDWFNIEDYE